MSIDRLCDFAGGGKLGFVGRSSAAALGYLNRICWSRLLSRKEVARKQGFEVYKKKETIEWRFTEGSWANPRRLGRWAARYRRKRVELNDRSYETGSKIPSLRFETRLPSGSR